MKGGLYVWIDCSDLTRSHTQMPLHVAESKHCRIGFFHENVVSHVPNSISNIQGTAHRKIPTFLNKRCLTQTLQESFFKKKVVPKDPWRSSGTPEGFQGSLKVLKDPLGPQGPLKVYEAFLKTRFDSTSLFYFLFKALSGFSRWQYGYLLETPYLRHLVCSISSPSQRTS